MGTILRWTDPHRGVWINVMKAGAEVGVNDPGEVRTRLKRVVITEEGVWLSFFRTVKE